MRVVEHKLLSALSSSAQAEKMMPPLGLLEAHWSADFIWEITNPIGWQLYSLEAHWLASSKRGLSKMNPDFVDNDYPLHELAAT